MKLVNISIFVLTVTLFPISTKFEARMTRAAEGAQHVDTSMGTLGMAWTALINVYRTNTHMGRFIKHIAKLAWQKINLYR